MLSALTKPPHLFYKELESFHNQFHALLKFNEGYQINDYIYVLGTRSPDFTSGLLGENNFYSKNINLESKYDLTISCLIHGDELGGLKALNRFLSQLYFLNKTLDKKICLILGNLKAAEKGVRFIEKDLNRSFGLDSSPSKSSLQAQLAAPSYEIELAQLLEPHLFNTNYYVDLHQTRSHTLSDFYIFPASRANIHFAHSTSPQTPIVVHEKEFSSDGQCSDTFVTQSGGVAVTYEMGSIGHEEEKGKLGLTQIDKTVSLLWRAYNHKEVFAWGRSHLPRQVLSWDQVIASDRQTELVPHLYNFQEVHKDFLLGYKKGQPFYASSKAYILFPKYGDLARTSSELCRLVKPYNVKELSVKNLCFESFTQSQG